MTWAQGGQVAATHEREYGDATIHTTSDPSHPPSTLFKDLPNSFQVWMSHGDQLSQFPAGFQSCAKTATAPHVAIGNTDKRMYG